MFMFHSGLNKPVSELDEPHDMPEAQFDWKYLSEHNAEEIRRNIRNRKDVGDIDRVVSIVLHNDQCNTEA